jgi:hypothetical protein
MQNHIAFVIGNGGLGDILTCTGMINYLATKYKIVFVACMKVYYEQLKYFFDNDKIKLYPVNMYDETTMAQFDVIMRTNPIYDIYAFGHYGSKMISYEKYVKVRQDGICANIIYDYPISYYDDVNIPIEYMSKYFHVSYPPEILNLYSELLDKYPKYTVVHQIGSTISFDIIKYNEINIDDNLVIDVNKNLYEVGHKYYDIANKFANLISVIFYTKLIENASSLYLVDSCIHAIALIVNVDNAFPRICYQRERRIKYGFGKFEYFLMVSGIPFRAKLPILSNLI